MRQYINIVENAFQSDAEWQEAFNNQDWKEALDLSDSPEQIAEIIEASGAEQVVLHRRKLPLYIVDDSIFEWNGKEKYATLQPKHMWIFEVDPETYFPDTTQQFNDNFWKHPYPLYHETTEKNVSLIQKEGLLPQNQTRGLGNRGIGHAVFTTSEIESAYHGYYGGEIFEIDTGQMAEDGYCPYASQEPQVVKDEMRRSLAHLIGLNDFDGEVESGVSEDTIILYGSIPAKYLTLID